MLMLLLLLLMLLLLLLLANNSRQVNPIHIRTVLQQRARNILVVALRCPMDRRPTIPASTVGSKFAYVRLMCVQQLALECSYLQALCTCA